MNHRKYIRVTLAGRWIVCRQDSSKEGDPEPERVRSVHGILKNSGAMLRWLRLYIEVRYVD